MPTLILSPRFTADAQALWRAAGELAQAGLDWHVHRLSSWRIPEDLLAIPEPILYVEALFGPTVAEQFGLRLLEPPIDWLTRIPREYVHRSIRLMTLGEARTLPGRAFIKPPNDKSFPAAVYSGPELPPEFDDSTPVLVSDVVTWDKEFRCFVLDRMPRTISIYLRAGELQRDADFSQTPEETDEALAFVRTVLADARIDLPRAAVLDVGTIPGRGWAIVEQNAAWGSGLYGCDPAQVLEVLRFAAVPVDCGG